MSEKLVRQKGGGVKNAGKPGVNNSWNLNGFGDTVGGTWSEKPQGKEKGRASVRERRRESKPWREAKTAGFFLAKSWAGKSRGDRREGKACRKFGLARLLVCGGGPVTQ